MTQEEKAKAYDKALKRAKFYHGNCPLEPERKKLEAMFPELVENEDEKIRKEINTLYSDIDTCISELLKARTDKDSEAEGKALFKMEGLMVATLQDLSCIEDYLENQKEQNSEDEEDNDFTIYHPLKNGKGEYECIPYSFYGSLTSFSEDKDLIDFLRTCFYTKEECNEWIEQQKEDEGYEAIPVESTLEYKLGFKTGKESEKQKEQKPLSTEETELNSIAFLEQMGYTCIPPGAKTAEWSEGDERLLETAIAVIEMNITGNPQISSSATPSGYIRKRELIERLKSLRPQLKENSKCEDCPNRGNTHQYLKGSKDRNRDLALSFMAYLDEHRPEGKMCLSNGECEDIDKAFRENDWGKIMRYVEKYRPSWKPSEEQMRYLLAVINDPNNAGAESCHLILESLYEQLKSIQ